MRAFADNYIWLIESEQARGRVLAVDPGESQPVFDELDRSKQKLAGILLTHHHSDHIGGAAALLQEFDVPIVAPDDARIGFPARKAQDGDRIEFAELGLTFTTLHIPGHTLSHIAFCGHDALFCGDTLFSAGCGRMFEGTAEQMNHSLNRLKALPPETRVFCGHEYTQANLRFALAVEPGNRDAADYAERVAELRAQNAPTLPSHLALETKVNPFLRCDAPAVRAAAENHAGSALAETAQVFGALRAWKDNF